MARKGQINKPRKKRERVERPTRFRKYEHLCVIVCEDEKTEPFYFGKFKEKFPNEAFFIRCIGAGQDGLGVVQQAIKEIKKLSDQAKKEIDFKWVVFDKDDFDRNPTTIQRFTDAYDVAEKNDIKIALSNEVFELWLLLHFQEITNISPIPRQNVYEMLEDAIKQTPGNSTFEYEHGNTEIIDKVIDHGNETLAIERAKVLDVHFVSNGIIPINANPSTKVFELVELLRGFAEYHNWKEN